jgi:uncharacterized repeat protein (TIGR03803 family)
LLADSAGDLYGTTFGGGAHSDGTVFEIAAGTQTVSTLVTFNGTNGEGPRGGLVIDNGGNLYGTTVGGGTANLGTVFKLAAGTNTFTSLISYSGANGSEPSNLSIDSGGNLYGTSNGGISNDGAIFELAAGSGSITTLASFPDPVIPSTGVIIDAAGNLFGASVAGGTYGYGEVYELAAGSNNIEILASFDGSDGDGSNGGLIADSAGNLYGTTTNGGPSGGGGTVFEVSGSGYAASVPEPATTVTIALLSSIVLVRRPRWRIG